MTRLYRLIKNVYTFIYFYAAQHEKPTKILTNTTVTFEFCTALDLINVFYSQVETKSK